MALASESERDEAYVRLLLEPISVCRRYLPRFGSGRAQTLDEFRVLYAADPFYSWFGLDSPLIYTAHKAAGGITSIYRQIGIGCQRLIQQVVMDGLGLTNEQANWSYTINSAGIERRLFLDARIPIADVHFSRRPAVRNWLELSCQVAGVSDEIASVLQGAVFEVRQGYKSKDSKRQNADLANAAAAYAEGYLPIVMLLSVQIDTDVARRYQNARWLLLRGTVEGSPSDSTYEFCRTVLGYDLAAFFSRQSTRLRGEVETVLEVLLG